MSTYVKYVLSYFKRDWKLEDYPIEVRHQQLDRQTLMPAKFEFANYVIRIIGWLRMIGTGDTQEEAYEQLRQKFYEYKREGNKLPRPGTTVPLQWAPRLEVVQHEAIATDFFQRVLEIDYHQGIITDQSSLWDFSLGYAEDELRNRVLQLYDVEISDIVDGNLVRIFETIEKHTTSYLNK